MTLGKPAMLNLTTRQQLGLGFAFFLLMAATRSHHWASIHSLPDADPRTITGKHHGG